MFVVYIRFLALVLTDISVNGAGLSFCFVYVPFGKTLQATIHLQFGLFVSQIVTWQQLFYVQPVDMLK